MLAGDFVTGDATCTLWLGQTIQESLFHPAHFAIFSKLSNGPMFTVKLTNGSSLAYNGFLISTANLMLMLPDIADHEKDEAIDTILTACLEIAKLIQWLQRSLGLEHFSTHLPHSATLSAYQLLPLLDRPGAAEAFHVIITALFAVSLRWLVAHGVLRMIWIEVLRRDLTFRLDESTLSLLKQSAVNAWGLEYWRFFEDCTYPNYAAVKERGVVLAEMGELLREYSHYSVSDEG